MMKTSVNSTASLKLAEGCLHLSGVVDKHSVPDLHKQSIQIAKGAQPPTEICLQAVEHIDSAGLALLLEWCSWAQRANQTLSLSHAPAQLRKLAKLSELDSVLGLE